MTDPDPQQALQVTLPSTPTLNQLLADYQQTIDEIVNELRMIVGTIHPSTGTNRASVLGLYLKDINDQVLGLKTKLSRQQGINSEKKAEIKGLKLEVKALKSDYQEMKTSLILEIGEQKVIHQRNKEELLLEKVSLQNTLKLLFPEIQKKDSDLKLLREVHEMELNELKSRMQSINLASLESLTEIQPDTIEQTKTTTDLQQLREQLKHNYETTIQEQKQEINLLICKIKGDIQEQNGELVQIIQHRQELTQRIHALQEELLAKGQQIARQLQAAKDESARLKQCTHTLKMKEEQALELKLRVFKLGKELLGKETQVGELRSSIERSVKEKDQNNTYLSGRWQHEIERVILNAQLEFDREKNRIKKVSEERIAQIELDLGDKIQQLELETTQKETKLQAVMGRVKELETVAKQLWLQTSTLETCLRAEIEQLTLIVKNQVQQIQILSTQLQTTSRILSQSQKSQAQTKRQLQSLRLGMEQFKRTQQSEKEKQLELQRMRLQQVRAALQSAAEKELQTMAESTRKESKANLLKLEAQFKSRREQLLAEIEVTREENKKLLYAKSKEMEEEKEEAKRGFDKAMRTAKHEFRQEMEEQVRTKNKLIRQLKQLGQLLKSKQEEILRGRLSLSELQKQKKSSQEGYQNILRQKNQFIQQKADQARDHNLSYTALRQQLVLMTQSHQQIKYKYDNVQSEIEDLKGYLLSQHHTLVQKHAKIVDAYKNCIKQIEQNCFSHADRSLYVKQIKKLKQINSDVSTDLANAESKLITLKGVTRYQITKLEESPRHNTSQGTYGEELLSGYRLSSGKLNRQASQFSHYQSIQNLETSHGYEKLSRNKKRPGNTPFQRSRMKKSRVGFTEIDSYSVLSITKDKFKLNILNSPETIRQIRSALDK